MKSRVLQTSANSLHLPGNVVRLGAVEAVFIPPGSSVLFRATENWIVVIVVIIRRKLHTTKRKLRSNNLEIVTRQ